MTLTAHGAHDTSSPIVFDPYDYGFQEDPYPVYTRLRGEDPLHHNDQHDFWVLSRHADVAAALKDDTTFSNSMGVSVDKSAWGPDAHKVMSFLAMDPPRQQRLRALVSKGFTPRRVRDLSPRIQALTDAYLDKALPAPGESGTLDWIPELAGKLPMDVISEMMGVPEPDRDEVRRLADLVVHREDGVYDVPEAGMAAALELIGYYSDLLEQRKRQPTEDLTSALLHAAIDGDRLDDHEIIAFLFLTVVAGNETTTKLLGNALFHLSAHPAQKQAVLGDLDLVAPWIEETLRFDTSSQMLARYLKKDLALHGKVSPAGSKLVLVLGSANRDERVFTRAGDYDVHRDKDEVSQLISFGGGRHFCLGAHLARLEARIALEELVRRVRSFDVDREAAVRVHSTNVRGFASLPIEVEMR
ncbi:MAG TPA: cytochrome P450 [Nocardioidaceae bacterium]